VHCNVCPIYSVTRGAAGAHAALAAHTAYADLAAHTDHVVHAVLLDMGHLNMDLLGVGHSPQVAHARTTGPVVHRRGTWP